MEMRKPDEWDVALDKGKTKKVRKNKLANKRSRHGKANPFQQMAEKKQKKELPVCYDNGGFLIKCIYERNQTIS